MAEKKREEGSKRLGLMQDVVPELVSRGEKVQGFLTDDFWYDVGSLERYEKLNNETADRELSFLNI